MTEIYPYEAHITVHPHDVKRARAVAPEVRFVEVVNYPDIPDCFSVMKFQNPYYGDVRSLVFNTRERLHNEGVQVLRWKIETSAWNRGHEPLYWETHLRVAGASIAGAVSRLNHTLYSFDPLRDKHWITCRTRPSPPAGRQALGVSEDQKIQSHHQNWVHKVVTGLTHEGIAVLRPPETEVVIVDTCMDHDAKWEGR